jgi:hypothetical protein
MEEKFEYTKDKSEAINRRRTDNALQKIKRTKNKKASMIKDLDSIR